MRKYAEKSAFIETLKRKMLNHLFLIRQRKKHTIRMSSNKVKILGKIFQFIFLTLSLNLSFYYLVNINRIFWIRNYTVLTNLTFSVKKLVDFNKTVTKYCDYSFHILGIFPMGNFRSYFSFFPSCSFPSIFIQYKTYIFTSVIYNKDIFH